MVPKIVKRAGACNNHLRVDTGSNSALIKTSKTTKLSVESRKFEVRKLVLKRGRKCNECDKLYTTKSNLNNHVKKIHGGSKPHSCIFCKKTFSEKSTKRKHEKNRPKMCLEYVN